MVVDVLAAMAYGGGRHGSINLDALFQISTEGRE